MAQLSTLRTEIRNITGAIDTSEIADSVFTDLINKGQNLLADEANLFEAYGTRNAVSGTAEYTMLSGSDWTKVTESASTSTTNLSDMTRIYRVDYNGNKCTRINKSAIYDIANDSSEFAFTTSKAYYIHQNKLGIFPIPSDTSEIKVYYFRTPTALSSDSDNPEMDSRFDEALIYYGCWRIMERLRDINMMPYFKNEFLEMKQKIIDDGEKRFGEMTFEMPYNDF